MRWALTLLSVGLAGCAVGPEYARPAVPQPARFAAAAQSGSATIPEAWWRLYSDVQLDRLIERANASNPTLLQALARVDEARALARVAAADFYPAVTLSPSVSRQRLSANRPSTVTGTAANQGVKLGDWLLPLNLSWQLDVWGRVRRSVEAADAQLAAAIDDAAAARLSIQADVAHYYYALHLMDTQGEILARTITSYQEQVRLLSVQVETGLASPIVLNQAQAQLYSTLAQESDVARARANQAHALAILCGEPAPTFQVPVEPWRAAAPPVVPPGLPASILVRRPDVARAEQSVIAANASVGVATADLYPSFNLTGSVGLESASIDSLFSWASRLASLVGSITAPLFQGGRLRANLSAAEARYQQAVAAYIQQVLIAYSDVEDALTDLHSLSNQVDSLTDAVRASEDYRRLADVQYKNGLVDYLTVIDADRTLLSNQLALAQTTNLQMSASIQLIKALGGGWLPPRRTGQCATETAECSTSSD